MARIQIDIKIEFLLVVEIILLLTEYLRWKFISIEYIL